MLKAASLALLRFPILNSSLSEDEKEVIYHSSHEIGVAMATSKGLIVPVLRKVQEKSLMEIARELAVFQAKAEGGQGGREGGQGGFKEEDFQGATFSMSNIGSVGGTYMDAKIVPPQVAIGAVGRIQTLPRFAPAGAGAGAGGEGGREGGWGVVMPVRVMAISWAGDHRVVDGATMARFSNLWKTYLEEPALMLAETR
jgi:2-oxoisovalerate dehydrogenase E2 component (dihydrolipoyl transacylase)